MFVCSYFAFPHVWAHAFSDAALLSVLLFPVFYLFSSRPLIKYISRLERAREEINSARGELEIKIAERTKELKRANDELGVLHAQDNENIKKLKSVKVAMINMMQDMKEAQEELQKLYMKEQEHLKEIGEVNRRKTEFVSGVSHELRTPLASIKGFTSTVRSDKAMDEKTRDEFLKIVEDETDRLTRLIDDLLDLSRIESGRLKIKEEKLDIAPLIKKCVEALTGQSKERNIQLQLIVPDSLPEILADRDKVTQILVNLLSNAIKYTQNGGKVTVTGGARDDAVIVEVSDTGVGISKENLPHIFERFYRIEKPGIEAKGTGLGLSITKALAEVFHGRIDVESEEGKGSKFTLSLPK
jgi:signal transduction histidine kinase